MRVEVFFTSAEAAAADLSERIAVIVDVLRATSTMVEALANGARGVFPVASTDEAVRLTQNLGRDNVVLCGERRSLRVEGFDLGNSPREFTPSAVRGKLLVMATTNGTPAVVAAGGAERRLVAALLNLSAVAGELVSSGAERVAVVCAGRERRFAIEDALCAGLLIERIGTAVGEAPDTDDAGAAALTLARENAGAIPEFLARSAAGRQLREADLEEDIAYCASIDLHPVVPVLRDRQVTL